MSGNARTVIDMFSIVLDALAIIERYTDVGGEHAEKALIAIKAIVSRIREGFDGETTPEIVKADLEEMLRELLENDVAADSALDAKFRGSSV